jgi:hypothetical protein
VIDTDVHFERVIEDYRGHDIVQHHKGALTWYTIGRSSERYSSRKITRLTIDNRLKNARR